MPQKTSAAGLLHGGASHRDTGSQSPEADRSAYCRRAHSLRVRVPLLSLKRGEDELESLFDKGEKGVEEEKSTHCENLGVKSEAYSEQAVSHVRVRFNTTG